jgi:hypothetical protein
MDDANRSQAQPGFTDGDTPDAPCELAEGEAITVQVLQKRQFSPGEHVVEESEAGSACGWTAGGVKDVFVCPACEPRGGAACG